MLGSILWLLPLLLGNFALKRAMANHLRSTFQRTRLTLLIVAGVISFIAAVNRGSQLEPILGSESGRYVMLYTVSSFGQLGTLALLVVAGVVAMFFRGQKSGAVSSSEGQKLSHSYSESEATAVAINQLDQDSPYRIIENQFSEDRANGWPVDQSWYREIFEQTADETPYEVVTDTELAEKWTKELYNRLADRLILEFENLSEDQQKAVLFCRVDSSVNLFAMQKDRQAILSRKDYIDLGTRAKPGLREKYQQAKIEHALEFTKLVEEKGLMKAMKDENADFSKYAEQ